MHIRSSGKTASRRTRSAHRVASLALTALTLLLAPAVGRSPAHAQVVIPGPTIGYTGGFSLDDPDHNLRTIPGVFTWKSEVHVTGTGWRAFENVYVYIYGPLNTPGMSPIYQQMQNSFLGGSVLVPEFPADQNGDLLPAHFALPYEVANGVQPPGLYRIYAARANPMTVLDQAYSTPFSLSPDTIVNNNGVIGPNWSYERGARDGFLGDNSPERTDPEWVTVWSKRPVGLYATVAATDSNGANQPAHVAYHDYPWTHYGHDIDLHLVPDDDYRWIMATANFQGRVGSRETGRIEWEWETQNSGSPFSGSYGHGTIGVPLFATPTAGDRIYTVGSWVLDNGHPDEGDRSEIHPARMIATLRKRYTAVPFGGGSYDCKTRASQVDIYVSGHGGGLNHYYDELERMLDNNGSGGARARSFMPGAAGYTSVFRVYQQPGPESTSEPVSYLLDVLGFLGTVPDVAPYAGPSALFTDGSGLAALSGFPWAKGPEERPINDMDYEFDAPLPPPPAGATHPLVLTTQYPLHTTHVEEVITYTHPDRDTGLPTTAHIRIPYASGQEDNGIYARTLNFYWDGYSAPGSHYVVRMNSVSSSRSRLSQPPFEYFLGPQPLYLWADICGQWKFLTDLNAPGFLNPTLSSAGGVDTVGGLDQATFDVYLDRQDNLRVFTHGYAQRDMDHLFGNQAGLNAYDAGIQVAVAAVLGSGDNQDLGGALFDVPLSGGNPEGSYAVNADRGGSVNTVSGAFPNVPDPVFSMDFTVTHVPAPPHADVQGSTALGSVCIGGSSAVQLLIRNAGDTPLDVNSFSVSGAGYSLQPDPAPPYTLPGDAYRKLVVVFAPTEAGQGAGTLTVTSSDPCAPTLSIPLTASVIYPTLTATPARTVFPATVARCASSSTTVSVTNSGLCDLIIDGATMVGPAYSVDPGTLPLRIAPGGTAAMTVTFAPRAVAHSIRGILTIHSNDPAHRITALWFCGEGAPNGIRVIVLKPDGTPYPVVDQITVTSGPPKTNIHETRVPLTDLGPPWSCETLRYHLQAGLPPTNPSGNNGSSYELKVRVGSKTQRINFTLGSCEFKPITVWLP
jgi:hypothetical protein